MALGIDLGATKLRAGLVDRRGRVLEGTRTRPVSDPAPASVIREIEHLVRSELDLEAQPPSVVGVAIAAQVDGDSGEVLYAPNLRWRRVALARRLGARLHRPVLLENDVRAATYAEWKVGAGRGIDQLVLLWDGTGLGGGLVVDGRLLRGARGAAGELGHLTIVTNGRKCHCPNRGCLEAYVGGWAIADRAREAARAERRAGRPLLTLSGGARRISARSVFAAARSGDPLSRRLVRETEEHLIAGAVTVTNALNPLRILLGGPILADWRGIDRRVERALRARCQPPAARSVTVRRAGLGEWSPIVGAALRAFEANARALRDF